MDDDRISELNAAHLGHRYSTDVLSFRYDPMPGEDAQYVGEVVINVAMAARKGMRAGWSPEREVALYIAHGCDHLSGATDEDVAQRRRMRRRELRWLRGASDAGLTGGILKGTD